MPVVLVAVGGAAGAVARYLVDGFVSARVGGAFPWGTLVINASGSFVVGLLFALAIERGVLSADVRLPLMTGFLGAYTTFSTWMLESWRLAETGSIGLAAVNAAGSVAVGVACVVAGLGLGRAIG